ncbi:GGDEF domain-containing protein [Shewanella algicola]|uniref:GGDEF domain-containing protein n=1 Tax=Shewanella algicola TaxID=640633 RepID=UPI002494B134|nr:GGDEF domain-containing protein [Shewanella algicola]
MLPMIENNKPWLLIGFYQSLVKPLGAVGFLLGIISFMGYLFGIEALYRPIVDGPATNPLTAICMIFLGLGLLSTLNKKNKKLQYLLGLVVIVITISNISDFIFDSNVSTLITPFYNQVLIEQGLGKPNDLGFNSALMFLGLGFSLSLYHFKRLIAAQLIAFITLAIPMISITGYAYGLDEFYGKMSLLTASTGVAFSIATLALTANIGAVKAILSPYIGGRIARLQTICGYAIPSILGYLLVKSLNSASIDSFGLYVVTICWFIILMVSISAIFQERVDIERRKGERLLSIAAMSDNLTGLANRRKFIEFGQEAVERIKRTHKQVWILMLDIDYFKRINDTAGHAMGDKVLIEVSKTLEDSVRVVDLVSRMGGEEFSVILIDADIKGVELVTEKIRSNVENMHIEGWTDLYGPVTISIGCELNDGTQTLDQTLKDADGALYQAKHNGRNQVCFARAE